MAQFLRPDNDDSIGSWTDEASGTTDIYTGIDEETAEDTEHIRSEDDPSSSVCIIGLSTGIDPLSSINHIIRYRYGKGETGGGSPGDIDLIVELREGTTVIASNTHLDVSTTVADGSFTLTGGEADNITDYSNLNIRFTADKSSGARTSWGLFTWQEFQIPNATITLTVQDSLHSHLADNVALTQANTLVVQESLHNHLADNIVLVQANILVVAEANHGHLADNVALIQANTLVVQDSLHAHTVDGDLVLVKCL